MVSRNVVVVDAVAAAGAATPASVVPTTTGAAAAAASTTTTRIVQQQQQQQQQQQHFGMSTTADKATASSPLPPSSSSTPRSPPPRDFVISTAEAMNPTRRPTMEDVCVVHRAGEWGGGCGGGGGKPPRCCDALTYIGVYDGHGGREMVDFLQHAMHYHVAQELADYETTTIRGGNTSASGRSTCGNSSAPEASMTTRLERAFLMADIHAQQAQIHSSGATVAVCLLERDESHVRITTGNVGDSRIVLGECQPSSSSPTLVRTGAPIEPIGGGLVATRLTVDHGVDDPLEVARIVGAGGFMFKDRVCGVLAVTRSLGDQLLKPYVTAHPAVAERTVHLSPAGVGGAAPSSSCLIVACDGVWDVLTDQEAVDLVHDYDRRALGAKQDVADYLVAQALQRGTADNVTAVVVWL